MPNFDFTDIHVVLRMVCGAWLLPHTYTKLTTRGERRAEITGFFASAGLKPAEPLVILAMFVELTVAFGLILGIYPRYAALLGALYLGVATVAVFRVSGGKWIWFHRGPEFPALYAAIMLILAIYV